MTKTNILKLSITTIIILAACLLTLIGMEIYHAGVIDGEIRTLTDI